MKSELWPKNFKSSENLKIKLRLNSILPNCSWFWLQILKSPDASRRSGTGWRLLSQSSIVVEWSARGDELHRLLPKKLFYLVYSFCLVSSIRSPISPLVPCLGNPVGRRSRRFTSSVFLENPEGSVAFCCLCCNGQTRVKQSKIEAKSLLSWQTGRERERKLQSEGKTCPVSSGYKIVFEQTVWQWE